MDDAVAGMQKSAWRAGLWGLCAHWVAAGRVGGRGIGKQGHRGHAGGGVGGHEAQGWDKTRNGPPPIPALQPRLHLQNCRSARTSVLHRLQQMRFSPARGGCGQVVRLEPEGVSNDVDPADEVYGAVLVDRHANQ